MKKTEAGNGKTGNAMDLAALRESFIVNAAAAVKAGGAPARREVVLAQLALNRMLSAAL